MAVTSNRQITITFGGDVEYAQTFTASTNAAGSGDNYLINLSSGNNTVSVPDNCVAVTIIPPVDNEEVITLKGINGDTGIALALEDPCSLSLASSVTSFVLNASDAIEGVRIIFS